MRFLSSVIISLVFAMQAHAAMTLELHPNGETLKDVALADSAKIQVDGRDYQLTTVGTALAKRNILGISLNVYVGQLLMSEPDKFVRTIEGALESTKAIPAGAMRLTMLRNLDGGTVDSAFQEALEVNEIDTNTAEMKKFSSVIAAAGALRKGESIYLVCEQFGDHDVVTFHDTQGRSTHITGSVGFANAVYSMFIGAGGTPEREGLRRQLITGQYDNE